MKKSSRNHDVCSHDSVHESISLRIFLVNKSSPLAQFSIDYEEIDDDDDNQSSNNQEKKSTYDFSR